MSTMPQALFKKLIGPLASKTVTSPSTSSSTNSSGTNQQQQQQQQQLHVLFDSDVKFQRVILFVVDLVFVVFDKISDASQNTMSAPDCVDTNDEITLHAFAIVLNALCIGLEMLANANSSGNTNMSGVYGSLIGGGGGGASDWSSRTRNMAIYRANLTFLRAQFKRLFVFMLHPNHKWGIKLKLIKTCLASPHSLTILKCLAGTGFDAIAIQHQYHAAASGLGNSSSGGGSSNINNSGSGADGNNSSLQLRLAFYINCLLCTAASVSYGGDSTTQTGDNNQQQQQQQQTVAVSNSDREIIAHFNHLLVSKCGVDYKQELNAFLVQLDFGNRQSNSVSKLAFSTLINAKAIFSVKYLPLMRKTKKKHQNRNDFI